MSVVTGVCLFTSLSDENNKKLINDWLLANSWFPASDVAAITGGSKHPQWVEFSAGHNYFDDDRFYEFLKTLEWTLPALLVTQQEHQEDFTVRNLP